MLEKAVTERCLPGDKTPQVLLTAVDYRRLVFRKLPARQELDLGESVYAVEVRGWSRSSTWGSRLSCRNLPSEHAGPKKKTPFPLKCLFSALY